jgi:hypothetical protein
LRFHAALPLVLVAFWAMATGTGLMLGLAMAVACPSVAWAANAPSAPSVRLVWVRGENTEGCSDGAAMARRVSMRLSKNPFREDALTSIEGVIGREGQRWQAHLYMRGADGRLAGTRRLTSDGADCDGIDAAAALAIALAIDPEAALSPMAAPPVATSAEAIPAPATPTNPVAPPPGSGNVRPVAASVLQASHHRRAAQGTARGLVTSGLLPEASLGVALSTDVEVVRFVHATAGGLYLPEVHTGGDFAFGLTAGWAGGCFHPWYGARIDPALCGKVLVGAIHSVVFALEPAQPGDRLWAGAALSLEASLVVYGPLLFEIGGEAVAPITRDRFKVQGRSDPVFQPPSVAGTAFAGFGMAIP